MNTHSNLKTAAAADQGQSSSFLLGGDELVTQSLSNNNEGPSHRSSAGLSASVSSKCPMVEVVAPATLKAGYTFDVEVNREIFSVTVPPGGVQEGETLCVQTEPKIQEPTTLFRIPLGSWKDGLCDFFKYGPCHPSFLLSCLFPLISLGQIFTRLELRWNGSESHHYDSLLQPWTKNEAFKSMVWLTFFFMFMKQILISFESGYDLLYTLNIVYVIIVAILVGRTRRHMREKYDIPGTFTQIIRNNSRIVDYFGVDSDFGEDGDSVIPVCCGEVEDYCLGGCCYPCVLSQMSRHTAMYDTYEASFFNSNGMPEHAPMMV